MSGGYHARSLTDGVPVRSMKQLFELYETGKIKPHISARLPLAEAPAALAMVGSGKSTGKVVLQT